MFRFVLALVSLCMLSAAPAFAAPCNITATASVQNGYIAQDVGVVLEPHFVSQTDIALNCGKWSFDAWHSVKLSGRGTFFKRGGGDEVDLSGTYTDSMETGLGKFVYSATVGDYFFAPGFTDLSNDTVDVHMQVGRPFNAGNLTIMPYGRITEYLSWGGGNHHDLVLFRPGVQFDLPLTPWLTASVDVAGSIGPRGGDIFRPTAGLTASLGNDWKSTVGVKATDRTGAVGFLSVSKKF